MCSMTSIMVVGSQAVHVYNVIEHGRRFRRQLIYSTDSRVSLWDDTPPLKTVDVKLRYECGVPSECPVPESSLVITRNLSKSQV